MSADPRSNEEIVAEAVLGEGENQPRWVVDDRLARAIAQVALAALSAAGRHIVSTGEAVIDGQRGRLVRFPDAEDWLHDEDWLDDDKELPDLQYVWAFIPSERVSPGTDRPAAQNPILYGSRAADEFRPQIEDDESGC